MAERINVNFSGFLENGHQKQKYSSLSSFKEIGTVNALDSI